MFQITTVSTLLSVIIFTGLPLPHPTFMGAKGAHKRHKRYNYLCHRVQNSYQLFRKHYASIIFTCHPFQPSPIPLLRVLIFRIISSFDVTNLQKKNCLDASSTGRIPFPMSIDMHIHISYHPYGDGDST